MTVFYHNKGYSLHYTALSNRTNLTKRSYSLSKEYNKRFKIKCLTLHEFIQIKTMPHVNGYSILNRGATQIDLYLFVYLRSFPAIENSLYVVYYHGKVSCRKG